MAEGVGVGVTPALRAGAKIGCRVVEYVVRRRGHGPKVQALGVR